jgi:hypothetical protein
MPEPVGPVTVRTTLPSESLTTRKMLGGSSSASARSSSGVGYGIATGVEKREACS